jgi:hypothetical protein
MKSETFYMLEVPEPKPASTAFADKVLASKEQKRRKEAVMAFLKASGHRYNKRANMFATREDAEQMILRMGFPYPINICEASWAF